MPLKSSLTCCVVIPVYQASLTTLEEGSLRNACRLFSGLSVRFVSPNGLSVLDLLDDESRELIDGISDFGVIYFHERFFLSVQSYNVLMTQSLFYASFRAWDCILMAQLDSWIFSPNIDAWMAQRYSYVGAPWRLFPGLPIGPDWPSEAVGNGGLSLRRISHFLTVLDSVRFRVCPVITLQELFQAHRPFLPISSGMRLATVAKCLNRLRLVVFRTFGWRNSLWFYVQSGLNEDIVFGLLVPRVFRFWSVPCSEIAAHFALDADPAYFYDRYLHGELPLGCHAWAKSSQFWNSLDAGLPDPLTLQGMSDLQD